MDINALTNEIVEELRHPHNVALIKSAVRKAVKALHSSGMYKKDLIEETVNLDSSYMQAKVTLPPFHRRFKLVTPCDLAGNPLTLNTEDGGLPCVEAGDTLTYSGVQLSKYYYIAGSTFVFRSPIATNALFLVYYATPDLREGTAQTWITQQYPELVKDGAKYMYLLTSDKERADGFRTLYEMQLDVMFSEQGGKE